MKYIVSILNTNEEPVQLQLYQINSYTTLLPNSTLKLLVDNYKEIMYYHIISSELNLVVSLQQVSDSDYETLKIKSPSGIILGKNVSELCESLKFPSGYAIGTLKYVRDYTEFSSNENEQEGYFLPFEIVVPEGTDTSKTTGTFKVIGGSEKLVNIDTNDFTVVIFLGKTESDCKSKSIKLEVDWNNDGNIKEITINVDNLTYEL